MSSNARRSRALRRSPLSRLASPFPALLSSLLALALAPSGCATETLGEGDAELSQDSEEGAVGEAASAVVAAQNIARGKPASQSSTYSSGAASRAVDGNTDGAWGNGSVTHTNSEAQAWWQVDLLGVQDIGDVVLHNRTDCCSDRLSNFDLLVSDDGASWQSYPHPGVAGQATRFAVNRTGRYVKVRLNGTNNLSLAEVQVFHPTPNLAAGKPTSQSSTAYAGVGSSSSAVDGNANGDWLGGSVTHTNSEAQPWWQVDLQSVESIGDVVLYNRTDCCSNRLSDFELLVSDDGATWQSYPYPGTAPSRVTFAVDRTARYVKVQLHGTNPLSLAEVQVFAAQPNLALGKPTSQSSTAYTTAGAASKAVDGDTDGAWTNGSVTHTNSEAQPWWQVDLESVQPIGDVVLHNRTDCCSSRLSNFNVLVSDDGATWQSYAYPGTAGARVTMTVNRTGRYVKVQLNGTNPLSLAEVQVLPPRCAPGQELLDGTTCVTLTPWPQHTDLPPGSQIAIRLRRVMVNYYGGSVVWPKWVGVSPSDPQRIDAVDEALTSRNLFTVTTFRPAGEVYYDLPWYRMQASTGMFVGDAKDGTGKIVATYDGDTAGVFARGSSSWNSDSFLTLAIQWSQVEARLAQVKSYGNHYSMCESPFTLGTPSVVGWYDGGSPNYGCYVSGDVDYFVVE